MHDVHYVCFVNTDFRSLTLTCIIYTCYKCLACKSKMASILNLIVGSSVGCPLKCPLFPYLKVVGYPLSCPPSCPLYPYMAVVGSLICMANFPWAAHGQPTPLPTELPTFFIFGSSGLPTELATELPTELPTVSIYGSSGQPNLHGKIPMGSPRAAHSVAHMQPMGSEVGSSNVFFPYRYSFKSGNSNIILYRSVCDVETSIYLNHSHTCLHSMRSFYLNNIAELLSYGKKSSFRTFN